MIVPAFGLRVGEALAVHRSDVDLTTATLTVSRSMNRQGDLVATKGRKRADQGRTISIPPDLAERLRVHMAAQPPRLDGSMFASPTGRPIRYTNWRKRTWSPVTTIAGVDATPHDLRHTCATRLFVVDRWGPAEVQHFLGHSDPRTTLAIYTHVTSDDLPTPSALISTG